MKATPKPCPSCGSWAGVHRYKDGRYIVICPNLCNMRSNDPFLCFGYRTRDLAIKAWNEQYEKRR